MKGYKVLDKNMCSFLTKTQYELDTEYCLDSDEISLFDNKGFHFCQDLVEALKWIGDTKNYHVYEIDTLDGVVINGLFTSVTSKIKFVRKVTYKEIANAAVKYLVNEK